MRTTAPVHGERQPLRREAAEKPGLGVRIKAALRRRSLDGHLAAGADPASSPLLAHRAAQLTGADGRAMLAQSVREAISANRRPLRLSAAVPLNREEVARAGHLLVIVEASLGSAEPVYAQGMAMLRRLLSDGASPLFAPRYPGALSDELERIITALRGRQAR